MRAASSLIADGTLVRAVGDGAVVLAVCAGFQLVGRSFPDAGDRPHEGLGLLDVATRKGGPRPGGGGAGGRHRPQGRPGGSTAVHCPA